MADTERHRKHAFISYVHADRQSVDRLQRILEANGIPVWRDTEELWAGQDWRAEIKKAITNNSLVFIACFSHASLARPATYQNNEIHIAIEQLKLRRPDVAWLLPVRFSECQIPAFDLGGGRDLEYLQRVDLFDDRWDRGADRLVKSIKHIMAVLDQAPADNGGLEDPSITVGDPTLAMRSADLYRGEWRESPGFDERSWARLVDQAQRGDFTPFIGVGVTAPGQPSATDLAQAWAQHYDYPFANDTQLPEVMRYAMVVEQDPVR